MESLRWVRRNIEAFGGDPHNVTIYGQSAGGQAVCNMLAIPSAKGLFQRAIAESSACTNSRNTLAAGEESGVKFATAVGCTDPATGGGLLAQGVAGHADRNQCATGARSRRRGIPP
jgi:para-nitrobenzyl esterase